MLLKFSLRRQSNIFSVCSFHGVDVIGQMHWNNNVKICVELGQLTFSSHCPRWLGDFCQCKFPSLPYFTVLPLPKLKTHWLNSVTPLPTSYFFFLSHNRIVLYLANVQILSSFFFYQSGFCCCCKLCFIFFLPGLLEKGHRLRVIT